MHDPGKTISVSTLLNNRDNTPETSLVQLWINIQEVQSVLEWLWDLVDAGQPVKVWLSEWAVIPFSAGGAVKAH